MDILASKDDEYAYAYAKKIVSESRESDCWYSFFDEFIKLLEHPKSLVRNRAIYIIAANARWDSENRLDAIIDEDLKHTVDINPITARECIRSLVEIGKAKPKLVDKILETLNDADLSQYRDSMRPLIEKDIKEAVDALNSIKKAHFD